MLLRILRECCTLGLAFMLVGCTSSIALQTTAAGIARKLVVRHDSTPLFSSTVLDTPVEIASQWEIYFIFGEGDNYYVVGRDMQTVPETPQYVRKSDVIEWNSHLALNYANSPDVANRDQVYYYATLEEAQAGHGDVVLEEKPTHSTEFGPMYAMPVLQDFDSSVYYIVTLYDNVDENGEYRFLGEFDFGYVQFNPCALEFRRYTSRQELSNQMEQLIGVTGRARQNMDPDVLDGIYGGLSDLLATFRDGQNGADEIRQAFASGDLPDEASGELYSQELTTGRDWEAIDQEIWNTVEVMRDYSLDSENWTVDGYGFVPAEWLQGQSVSGAATCSGTN